MNLKQHICSSTLIAKFCCQKKRTYSLSANGSYQKETDKLRRGGFIQVEFFLATT